MIFRRVLMLSALAIGLLAAVPGPARAADEFQGAKDFINNLSSQAIATMTKPGVGDAERIPLFRKLFAGSVDLPFIGKLVLARHWRTATPEQQQEFLKLFEDMVVLTWAPRFKDAGDKVTIQAVDAKADIDQGIVVESSITREKQEPISVLWRVRQQPDNSYRVVDLKVEGTSMLLQYRDEYASVINQNGGKVEGLLEALRKKVAQLSQPAVN